jgi:hypothetical protein
MNRVLSPSPAAEVRLSEDHRRLVDVADDVASFGVDAAQALSELPIAIAGLNRTYRHLVARRSLLSLPQLNDWLGTPANVFLRHDAVFVFAIHHHPHVGMANFVELHDATFVVDEIGRQQTLQKTGTLPNHSTVHAFVSGRLIRIQNEALSLDLQTWHPVLYRPDQGPHFLAARCPGELPDVCSQEFQPVQSASRVLMVPGRVKVWCQNPAGFPDRSQTAFPRVPGEDTL